VNNTVDRGKAGEDMAVDYLMKKGYRILRRNFRFYHGEIDIVAEDGKFLVFIEVKSFRSKMFGEPEDAVNEHKRKKLRRTANGYLIKHGIEDRLCRFDVVAIDLEDALPRIRHIQDAF